MNSTQKQARDFSGKRTFSIVLATLFLTLLSACAKAPATLEYSGLSAETAADKILASNGGGGELEVIQKVASSRAAGFKWNVFWDRLKGANYTPTNKADLLNLHGIECSPNGFSSFADFALDVDAGLPYLIGEKRACADPLSQSQIIRVRKLLAIQPLQVDSQAGIQSISLTRVREAGELLQSKYFIQLIKREFANQPSDFWRTTFQDLSVYDWQEQGFRRLLEADRDGFFAIVDSYNQLYPEVNFLQNLLPSLFNDQEALKLLDSMIGTLALIRLLDTAPARIFKPEEMAVESIRKSLTFLAGRALNEELDFDATWGILIGMRRIERKISRSDLDNTYRLNLIWSLHQAVEKRFKGKKDDLLAQENTVDRAYILSRMGEKVNTEDVFLWGAFDRLILNRIEIRQAEKESDRKELMDAHCEMTSRLGFGARELEAGAIGEADLQIAGCLTLKNIQGPLRFDRIVMHPDLIVRTEGSSLKIEADFIDASNFDLSTIELHEDLPVEDPPKKDHAVILPLLLNLELTEDIDAFYQRAAYFFVFHYVVRLAKDGRPADVQAAKGFAGGDLEISIQDKESVVPSFVSLGGLGQKAAPARLGGDGDESRINWNLVRGSVAITELNYLGETIPVRTIPNPTLGDLRELLQNARREPSTNRILIHHDFDYLKNVYLPHLRAEDLAKIKMICDERSQTLAICLPRLMEEAGKQLTKLIHDNEIDMGPTGRLPQTNSVVYRTKSGELGPRNTDGEFGESGTLTFIGLE